MNSADPDAFARSSLAVALAIRTNGNEKPKRPATDVAKAAGSAEFKAYLSEMECNIDVLQSDVELRDEQIDALKIKLDALLNGEAINQQQSTSITSEATTQLIAMLKEQIKQLEEEKKASDAEDQKQNALIAAQESKLTAQQDKLTNQEYEIRSLRQGLSNVMAKLGMK